MNAPDKGIPEEVLGDAKCIAVVPSMIKIAVGFGGHYGRGVATCRTQNGWSAPAPILLTGGSWGLQFGGEAVDLVMLVMNQKGMDQVENAKQFTDTLKHQPWRLIYPSTKKYPEDEQAKPPPNDTVTVRKTTKRQRSSRD